jgi:hypothetical protein
MRIRFTVHPSLFTVSTPSKTALTLGRHSSISRTDTAPADNRDHPVSAVSPNA